jgi:hypothetical protein
LVSFVTAAAYFENALAAPRPGGTTDRSSVAGRPGHNLYSLIKPIDFR